MELRSAILAQLRYQSMPSEDFSASLLGSNTAGYSGTPLIKKIGIKPGMRVALIGEPEGFLALLGELPPGVRLVRGRRGRCGLVVWFVRSAGELRRDVGRTAAFAGGRLWIAWPKKSSALAAGFGGDDVRAAGLGVGLVDFKVCAIDETWSGLRFSPRR